MIEIARVELSKEEAGIVIGALENAGFQGLNPARVAVAIIEKLNNVFLPKRIEESVTVPGPKKIKGVLKNQVRRG